MSGPTVTISQEEYNELSEAKDILDSLYAAGVDNWEGYEEAISILRHQQ